MEDIASVTKSEQNEIGIEFGQRPYHLGFSDLKTAAKEVEKMLENYNLKLLGFSGRGALQTRIDLARELPKRHVPSYFLVQGWFDNYCTNIKLVQDILDMGSCVALHPFRFGGCDKLEHIINTLKSEKIKASIDSVDPSKSLQYILDTAHIWLAKNDLQEVFADPVVQERLRVIHLKDWKKTYDSSLRYFSRGFTSLGEGFISTHKNHNEVSTLESDLGEFVQLLCEKGYKGWCVIEQDYTAEKPIESLRKSYNWLNAVVEGKKLQKKTTNEKSGPVYVSIPNREFIFDPAMKKIEVQYEMNKRNLIEKLQLATTNTKEEFSQLLTDIFEGFFLNKNTPNGSPVKGLVLWEIAPRVGCMQRVCRKGEKTLRRWHKIKRDDCNSFRLWKLDSSTQDLDNSTRYKDYYDEEFLKNITGRGANAILSFPLCNTYCYSQLEGRVDIFLDFHQAEYLLDILKTGCDETDLSRINSVRLDQYERCLELMFDDIIPIISLEIEKLCGNIASQAANDLVDRIESKRSVKELFDELTNVIESNLLCDYCTIYEIQDTDENVFFVGPILEEMKEREKIDVLNQKENIICKAYRYQDLVCLLPDHTSGFSSRFAFPVYDRARSRKNWSKPETITHVILCQFKRSEGGNGTEQTERILTASDENVIREMLHDFLPILTNSRATEIRAQSLGFISHELKHSLTSLHGALYRIQNGLRKHNLLPMNPDYIGEAFDYWDVMMGAVQNTDYLRAGKRIMLDRSQQVELLKDIIWPVIHQSTIGKISKEPPSVSVLFQGIPITKASGFHELPSVLNIDKSRFLQVFSNLLNNSIKYSHVNSKIEIEIDIIEEMNELTIKFRDWGVGISEKFSELIFEEGVRCPKTETKTSGDGTGLWLVRKIIETHGGQIKLTNNRYPTEFTMVVPNCFGKYKS